MSNKQTQTMLDPEVKKVTDAMEDLGFRTGFEVGDTIGLTALTLNSLKNVSYDTLKSVGYPEIYKFTVTEVTDKLVIINAVERDISMGFNPDSVHDNIFLIYRMGTNIPNAELFNIDNQNNKMLDRKFDVLVTHKNCKR